MLLSFLNLSFRLWVNIASITGVPRRVTQHEVAVNRKRHGICSIQAGKPHNVHCVMRDVYDYGLSLPKFVRHHEGDGRSSYLCVICALRYSIPN